MLVKKQISFVSENLSHDSHFVKSAVNKLFENQMFQGIGDISFWSDCAYHFRSKELMSYFDQKSKEHQGIKNITFNFFVEYHGKSQVDSNFGVLTRWLKDGENYKSIKTIDELIYITVRKLPYPQITTQSMYFLNSSLIRGTFPINNSKYIG